MNLTDVDVSHNVARDLSAAGGGGGILNAAGAVLSMRECSVAGAPRGSNRYALRCMDATHGGATCRGLLWQATRWRTRSSAATARWRTRARAASARDSTSLLLLLHARPTPPLFQRMPHACCGVAGGGLFNAPGGAAEVVACTLTDNTAAAKIEHFTYAWPPRPPPPLPPASPPLVPQGTIAPTTGPTHAPTGLPPPSTPPVMPPPAPPSVCSNECEYASDMQCDDGGFAM